MLIPMCLGENRGVSVKMLASKGVSSVKLTTPSLQTCLVVTLSYFHLLPVTYIQLVLLLSVCLFIQIKIMNPLVVADEIISPTYLKLTGPSVMNESVSSLH